MSKHEARENFVKNDCAFLKNTQKWIFGYRPEKRAHKDLWTHEMYVHVTDRANKWFEFCLINILI